MSMISLSELKRRKVVSAFLWYVVSAWVIIQVADVVGPALSLHAHTVRYLIYAALAGLPVALTLAWFFDFGSDKTKRTPSLEPASLKEGVPRTSEAYELYVRATHLSTLSGQWHKAIAMYEDCVTRDPKYAPAWARMARCYRLISKWTDSEAESDASLAKAGELFEHALQLNPDLPLTHSLYAQLEIDLGRPEEAMVRMLARTDIGGADAEIYAGLVQTCRFVGLLDESLVAYERARQLDPNVRTGVTHTYFMLERYEEALSEYKNADVGYLEAAALAMLGRADEAIALLRARGQTVTIAGPFIASLRATLEGNAVEAVQLIDQAVTHSVARDGEAVFYMARQCAFLGESDRALHFLQLAIKQGFVCHPRMVRDPWLDPLRGNSTFKALLRAAETRHRQGVESFAAANGRRILSVRDVSMHAQ